MRAVTHDNPAPKPHITTTFSSFSFSESSETIVKGTEAELVFPYLAIQ